MSVTHRERGRVPQEGVVGGQQQVGGVHGPVGPRLQDARDARAEPLLLHARRRARPRRVARPHHVQQPHLEPAPQGVQLYFYIEL